MDEMLTKSLKVRIKGRRGQVTLKWHLLQATPPQEKQVAEAFCR